MSDFASARAVSRATSEILLPANHLLPTEAGVQFKLRDKEGRDWDPSLTPYMAEPLDLLASRRYVGIAVVGPARTGKTLGLIHAGANYVATCAPGDTQIGQMSQDAANEFSQMEFSPVARHSDGLAERLNPRSDTVFSKRFRSGMTLRFAWPTVTQWSSKTLRYAFQTDYDRIENADNMDGEGPLWDQMVKRVTTYMSRGKALVESSPGYDYTDLTAVSDHDHAGPACGGIMSIYNAGTMARWYFRCLDCGGRHQAIPGPAQFRLPEWRELLDEVMQSDLMTMAAKYALIACPHCGAIHKMEHRREMNASGQWLHAGERFADNGLIVGDRVNTKIASYWLGGAAAAFQTWDDLLLKHFQAVREFSRTSDEGKLRVSYNTDFGAPYMPRAAAMRRKAEDLVNRSKIETWERGTVPKGVQFLIGAIDNQSYGFVCSVYGFGRGLETWLVDRFTITSSTRMDGERNARVDPASFDEDWDLLVDELLMRRYALEEAPELSMGVYFTHQDSGGAAGVSQRAYDFWRRLQGRGLSHLHRLVKGANSVDAARVKETSGQTSHDEERMLGPVPLIMLNTTTFKDAVLGDLNRDAPGPGYIHLPRWLDRSVFAEYVAETRQPQGWKKKPGQRNEQTDLHVYARAACALIGAESINWDDPPGWAIRPARKSETPVAAQKPKEDFFAALGRKRSGR